MASKDPLVLEHSDDSQLLMKTAVEFARSEFPGDHNLLLSYLEREQFLNRLDSREEYRSPPRQLRLARVMKTLMSNPAQWGKEVLVSLSQERSFVSVEPRQELLIRALVVVRPAPGEAVSFWNEHSQPESPYLHVTISALADNGSPRALALLEQKMADPLLEPADKVGWMRDPILRHRNDLPMLESCGRMLESGLAPGLRPNLVEALFDYNAEWYLSCSPPHPPPRLPMSDEARSLLRAIGNHALQSLPLDGSQIAGVEAGLQEIGS
jgi:hypothetical protein